LSGGFLEAFRPISTATEDNESDKVCHASAIKPIEPVVIPTQYLKINKIPLVPTEIQPTFSEAISTDFFWFCEIMNKFK
jgi:hypothetical protein